MSGGDPKQKLLADVHRFKSERNHEKALRIEVQGELIAVRLAGRLRHLSDFHRFVGIEAVSDSDGRILWDVFEARVVELLRHRPELASTFPVIVGGR